MIMIMIINISKFFVENISLGTQLSGRAFDCRSRGHRFKPDSALNFFKKHKITDLKSYTLFYCINFLYIRFKL